MSLIDMSQFDRVTIAGHPPRVALGLVPDGRSPIGSTGGPVDWWRRARDDVDAELAGSSPGQPVVAVRGDGGEDLVMGIAGPVDRATAQRLGALLRDLRPRSSGRLVITLTRLGSWDGHLVRVLGRVRIQHLIGGGHVELHDAPRALLAELERAPADPTSDRGSGRAPAGTSGGAAAHGGFPGALASEHDRAATAGSWRRLIVEIDRVGATAADHRDDPDWHEVVVVLEHVRATLSRELLRLGP